MLICLFNSILFVHSHNLTTSSRNKHILDNPCGFITEDVIKFRILSNLPKNRAINEKTVAVILSSDAKVPDDFKKCYDALLSSHTANVGRDATIEELRNIQAAAYAICGVI